ncbi:MAG: hypothetical protein HOB73_07800 [Planctomycetaceae bacterium]|jgi:hypothetical protein|nr:hypothetical protein [Planctomycetaceae bacterium]
MERIGQEALMFSRSLSVLWLLIPQVFLLLVSPSLYRRKGWRGLAGPAAALFSGFAIVGECLLLEVFEITAQYFESATGRVIYSLGFNILDIFPYAFLASLLFSYDRNVLDECRRLRGLANPNLLTEHNGKRGILIALLSFVLPISIITSPLGVVRSQWKLHGIAKGTIEPRGKGMVVLALGVYTAAIVSACIVFGLIIAALQFAHIEGYEYFELLYGDSFSRLPLHVVLQNPWLTVGLPFAIVMVGGFVAQRRYGMIRSMLGCTGVLLLGIASNPVEYNGVIPLTTAHIILEICAGLSLAIALWIPQQVEVKTKSTAVG